MPLFNLPEDDLTLNDIIANPNSFSGISLPGSNANYVGQTMGPGGMGMSAYMDRPETQPGWTGYDYRPGYDTNTYNLGQTDGPVGMGMSAYMDRPGPMQQGLDLPNITPYREQAGLKDWMKDKAWPWIKETGEGMKNQIPYFLDNTIPFYEPPEGYYDLDWEENKDMAGLEENDLYHLMRNGYTLEEAQEILNEQIGDGSFEMAKVYTNQMPGMIDEGFFWDSLTPEAEAINKVLNMPGIEAMRQSQQKWNYDDYNKMIPNWLREELPEDAFENLEDFQNQQLITII